jgi:hypothetical protein
LPGLSPIASKPLAATFDGGCLSSDGGVVVLREVARKLGLAEVIASLLPDDPMIPPTGSSSWLCSMPTWARPASSRS